MLINTVILFLRDLLPLFILLCYIKVLFSEQLFSWSQVIITCVLCILITVIFLQLAQPIGEAFNGAGIEILTVSLFLLGYSAFLLANTHLFYSQKLIRFLLLIGIISYSVVGLSQFLIFFNVYMHKTGNELNVLLGFITGLGICVSFSVLFYFILNELAQAHYLKLVKLGWYLFLAGQVSQVLAILSQVDMLEMPPSMVNFSHYVSDSSEYGHILNTLFGYEASPSLLHIQVNILAFVLPIALSYGVYLWRNKAIIRNNL